MPSRKLVAKELGSLLQVMSHPDRILLVQLLSNGDALAVSKIAQQLDVSATRVSQHLSLLRAYKVVDERRDGRQRLYSLAKPDMPEWLLDGIDFVSDRIGQVTDGAGTEAKSMWQGARRDQPEQQPINQAAEQ